MEILKRKSGELSNEIATVYGRIIHFIKNLHLERFTQYYIYVIWAFIFITLLVLILLIPLWIIISPILLLIALIIYTISITPYVGNILNNSYLQFYDWIFYKSNYPKKFLWRFIYDSMCLFYPQSKWRSMNYGYAILNENGLSLKYNGPNEDEIFCFQLYYFVASNHHQQKVLKGQTIVEVGCGRGGGINFILNQMQPTKCIGIDISDQQVQFCRSNYESNRALEFYQSDAESFSQLPQIPVGERAHIAIQISEGYYLTITNNRFVEEVTKVLKKGGMFYIADFRENSQIKQFEDDLTSTGLIKQKIVKKEDITINVLHALRVDEKRKVEWINNHTPYLIRPFFRKFSGLKDTRIFLEFQQRKTIYLAYSLQKQ